MMAILRALCGELAGILGGVGQTKNGICKIEIPRTDLNVTILGLPSRAAPTHSILFEKTNSRSLEIGELVLQQDEVPEVLSQLIDHNISIAAVHNLWSSDDPHLIYVHIEASMDPRSFARLIADILETLSKQPTAADSP